MKNLYMPATRDQLERMDPDKLISQYHSLTEIVKETTGIPFERNPQIPKEELIELIEAGQKSYLEEIRRYNLATSLLNWGERTGRLNKPVLVAGGQTQ